SVPAPSHCLVALHPLEATTLVLEAYPSTDQTAPALPTRSCLSHTSHDANHFDEDHSPSRVVLIQSPNQRRPSIPPPLPVGTIVSQPFPQPNMHLFQQRHHHKGPQILVGSVPEHLYIGYPTAHFSSKSV